MSKPNSEIQAEIQALETVLSALAPLDEGTRRRVLGYVEQRFGVAGAETPPPLSASTPPATIYRTLKLRNASGRAPAAGKSPDRRTGTMCPLV